jgi:hypothetical protein
VAALVASCREPIQYGGPIVVDEAGLHARLNVLCRVATAGQAQAECSRVSARHDE